MILYLREKRTPGRVENEALFRDALRDYADRRGIAVPSDAESLRFAYNPHGKPYFDAPPLSRARFSISHSGRYWAALFHETEVGLDIEDKGLRRGGYDEERLTRIAARFFTLAEQDYLLKAESEDDSRARFFRIWTGKEAYMKYTGNGFAQGLSSFSVIGPEAERVYDAEDRALRDVRLLNVPADADIYCACCLGGAGIDNARPRVIVCSKEITYDYDTQ
ncbi:MAG: 4'-phosphopantetheinyl transferase superfamily protein [Clostridiales Family XIII bacterium]|nr:4'-phosphopantetheinyl transferase superfamily protein [Clostridiales Family XIII bacterium]